MKILLLKIIKQIIYRFKERTPPEVKYSERNRLVAGICHHIDILIKGVKTNSQQWPQKQ